MFYIDWTYIILVLPAIAFSLWASTRVNTTFTKYSKQRIRSGMTGSEMARSILNENGLRDVRIECVAGNLTDHFDPKTNVVRLSESVYSGSTSAALGVAAHECGHAIQHAIGYLPLKIRSAIVPVTNLGAKLAMPLIMLGILFSYTSKYFIWVAYAGNPTIKWSRYEALTLFCPPVPDIFFAARSRNIGIRVNANSQ